jgi:hypothetical protein
LLEVNEVDSGTGSRCIRRSKTKTAIWICEQQSWRNWWVSSGSKVQRRQLSREPVSSIRSFDELFDNYRGTGPLDKPNP